jgi:hypothetical protein
MVTSWLQGTSTQVSLFTSRTMQTVYNHACRIASQRGGLVKLSEV